MQTISSDHWEVRIPDDWMHKDQGVENSFYFESPDHREGIYLSTWGPNGQPVIEAMLDARKSEPRNLPTAGDGEWEVLRTFERDDASHAEVFTEYFNRAAEYRIVSRIVGRADYFVRLRYHDYGCTDPRLSSVRSEPWIQTLTMRSGEVQ